MLKRLRTRARLLDKMPPVPRLERHPGRSSRQNAANLANVAPYHSQANEFGFANQLRVPRSLLLAFAALGWPSLAAADSENSIAPTDQVVMSPGQVDMRSGFFQHVRTDAAIGPNENGDGLTLVRTHTPYDYANYHADYVINNVVWASPFSMTHNWSIRLYENRVYLQKGNPNVEVDYAHRENRTAGDWRFYLHYGPSVTTFDKAFPTLGTTIISLPGTPFSDLKNDGSGATNNADGSVSFWAEKSDGTRIDFGTIGKRCGETNRRCAHAQSVTRPNGTRYDLTYLSIAKSAGVTMELVDTVTSNRGYGLKFFYNLSASDSPIKACLYNTAIDPMPTGQNCNPGASTEVSYTFSNLSFEASTPVGRSEKIETTSATGPRYISFYNGDDTTPWVTNYHQSGYTDAVKSQVLADGQTYTYSLDRVVGVNDLAYAGGSYVDSGGNTFDAHFEQTLVPFNPIYSSGCTGRSCSAPRQTPNGLTRVTDQLGRISTANYCDPSAYGAGWGCAYGTLQWVEDAEQARTSYVYSGLYNIVERKRTPKPGSGEPIIIETAAYNCQTFVCRTKMTQFTDGKGNTTNWEYSTVHGQVLRETLPPDANGVRPETRYTYQQKYAWLKSGSGYVRAATPIWMLVSQEYCRTSAADANGNCAAGASDEVVTTYQYEAGNASAGSNLHLLGMAVTADGQTLRTCYGYDDKGRRIFETQPKAGLATCQ